VQKERNKQERERREMERKKKAKDLIIMNDITESIRAEL